MLSTEELDHVIKQMKSGDESALKIIYDNYYSHIWFVCSKLCLSNEDTEEVVQDTFFRAYKNIKSLKEVNAMSGWLRAIAVRECYRKNNSKTLKFEVQDISCDVLENVAELNENFLPDSYVEQKELRDNLIHLIDTLPKKQKDVTYMFYFADMKIDEIASSQKCSVQSVKQALYLARNAMKGKVQAQQNPSLLHSINLVPLSVLFQAQAQSIAPISGFSAAHNIAQIYRKVHILKTTYYSVIGVAATGVVVGAMVLSGVFSAPPKTPITQVMEVTLQSTRPAESLPEITAVVTPEPSATEETSATKATPVQPIETLPEATLLIETEVTTVSTIETPVATQTPVTSIVETQVTQTSLETPNVVLRGDETQEQINTIISENGFSQMRLATSQLGDEYRLYGLVVGDEYNLIGTHLNTQTGAWKVKQIFTDVSIPVMSSMDLVDWMDN